MVQTTKDNIIITIPNTSPEEVVNGLKNGIVEVLQYQFSQYDSTLPFSEDLAHGNYLLLELLKSMMEKPS